MPGAETDSAVVFDGARALDGSMGLKPIAARGVLILGGWIGLAILLVGYPAASLLGSPLSLQFDTVFFVSVIGLTIAGCAFTLRVASRFERHFWRYILTINVVTLVSQAWYSWYMGAIDVAGPGTPSFADYLNAISAIAFIVLVVRMAGATRWSTTTILRHGVDLGALAAMMFVGIVAFYTTPLVQGTALDHSTAIWTVSLYPLVGLFLLAATFLSIVGWQSAKWLPWERLIAASLGIYAIGLLLSPVFRVRADYDVFNAWAVAYALVFLVGHYLMFLAALHRLASPVPWALRPTPAFRTADHAWMSVVLPVGFLLFGAVAWRVASDPVQPSDIRTLAWLGAAAMATGLSIRGVALVFENSRLRETSVTDPLTGLYDRREFFVGIAKEVDAAQRYGDPVGLIMLNIDGFAVVNNRLGARPADAVLVTIARAIKKAAGPGNTAYRLGGDEFAIIMPAATGAIVREVAHRVRGGILLVDTGCDLRLTASLGLALFPEDALDHVELARRADAAQYYAKTHGRDQIVRYDTTKRFDAGPKERAERLINESHLSTVRALAAAVDARDPATQFHSRNVARLSVRLAEELGLDRDRVEMIETAAVLHDIGKIGISDAVLQKPGKLTAAERREVNQHAALGERILAGTTLNEVLPWILAHHERWDGKGYPLGLAGDEIPYEARILCVCDSFDAMTSDRPYRSALSWAAALQEIDLNMGTQFDPAIAEAFIRMVGAGVQDPDEALSPLK